MTRPPGNTTCPHPYFETSAVAVQIHVGCCILATAALALTASSTAYLSIFSRPSNNRQLDRLAAIDDVHPRIQSPKPPIAVTPVPPTKLASTNGLRETLLPTRLAALLQSRLATLSEHLSAELSHLQSHLPPSLRPADDSQLPIIVLTTLLLAFALAPLPFLAAPMRRFFRSVFDGSDDDPAAVNDVIYVQHARDTLTTTFPKGGIAASTTTVADLRAAAQDALGLSRNHSIKLVFAGSSLTDDAAPLARYGVKHGAKVLCMASKSTLPPPTTTTASSSRTGTPGRPTPSASPAPEQVKKKIIPPIERIALVKRHVGETLMPLVDAFEASPPADAGKRKEEHHRLSETVLGEMLKLDSVDVDGPDGAEVRKRRKETVKELHAILERLDKVDKM
ncbi:hypothetical protein Dda_6052 [Drechslerella dactyloides]|uniref:BAG domain-containing protein n=1 Tax=Drechslerella dactyloides TaxID=74499 RepID=A0AAD6IV14_DREDA|nr:hypothetical protein Dda_6052 [Drechslerella dactyloides]